MILMRPTVSLGDNIRIRRKISFRNNYILSRVNCFNLMGFVNKIK
jgi:hypothetical protein